MDGDVVASGPVSGYTVTVPNSSLTQRGGRGLVVDRDDDGDIRRGACRESLERVDDERLAGHRQQARRHVLGQRPKALGVAVGENYRLEFLRHGR